jgi:hypothetical protein
MSRFRDFESRAEPPASRLFRRAESEMRRHQTDEAPDARAVRAASTGQWWGRRSRGAQPGAGPGGTAGDGPVSAPSGQAPSAPELDPAPGNALSDALSRLGSEAGTGPAGRTRPASRRRQRIWEVDTPPATDDGPLLLDERLDTEGPLADPDAAAGRAPSRPAGPAEHSALRGPDADEIAYARAQMARMSERGLVSEADPQTRPEAAPRSESGSRYRPVAEGARRRTARGEHADDRSWEDAARRAPRRAGAEAQAPDPDGAEADDDVARARAQIARMGGAAPPAAAASAGDSARARTRVLGFGGAAAPDDPFAQDAAEAPTRGAAFPVGWLVIVDGPGRGASFALTGGVAHLGRGADQTVCLDFGDDTISRDAHASVAFDPEDARHYLGAGAKSNLVRRNGRPVLGTEELVSGDLVRVGETTLRFVAFCDADFAWGGAGDTGERHG